MPEFFFNLLLIFLPTQHGLHFWPEWSMVLGRRVDYLSPTLYTTDILVGLTLVSWIIYYRNTFSIFNLQLLIKRRNFQFAIIILGFVCLNIIFASNKMVASYGWLKVLEYALLALYIVKTNPKFSSIIFFLTIGLFYSSIIAITQFILQRSIGGPLLFLGERTFSNLSPGIAQFNLCNPFTDVCALVMRAYGTFPHPNVLGGFLSVLLPLIVYELKRRNSLSKRKKILYIISLLAGAAALIFTFSRSAWVVTILGLAASKILIFKKKTKGVLVIAMAATIILFILSSVGIQDESVVVREALNKSAMRMFWQSPFFGKGFNNFLVELPKNLPSRQIYFLQPVHNIYLLILSETGLAGFVIFTYLIIKALRRSLKNIMPFHISLISLLLLGLVDHYLLTLQQGQLLFTVVLSLALIR